MNKKILRNQLREHLAAMGKDEAQARSAAAGRLLCEQPEYLQADVIMIFLSTPQEIDTTPIALRAWSDSKRVLAPRVSWEQRRMLPIEIRSLTTDVQPGMLGIREPVEGLPVPVSDIDLVVVPGLGFDARGNRLGRGRGFYDGFLRHRDFHAVACAIAYEEQVVESVPADEDDVCVDMLVTDVCVRRFSR
ncbi:MAG: 5-formyltetrahydrofolate cyclo-ligase [Planctomycetota bacterium]